MNAGLAFYLRLSMADGDLGKDNKDESNSIENQRELLQSFVESKEEFTDEIFEYIDDGYTGTNFNRPAFRRMIEDAKKGRIHTILVKDLSRLGRDYIGVGDYLEQIFPVLSVRFIAVNSNYDSNRYIGKTMGLDMAVSNLVNSLYSRDISKKVKSGFRARWKQGISTSARPPYGYIKDKAAKGGWRIDTEAAKIVKLIFEKASDGWSTGRIAGYLNEQGFTHRAYTVKSKMNFAENGKWQTLNVCGILGKYEPFSADMNTQAHSFTAIVRAYRWDHISPEPFPNIGKLSLRTDTMRSSAVNYMRAHRQAYSRCESRGSKQEMIIPCVEKFDAGYAVLPLPV